MQCPPTPHIHSPGPRKAASKHTRENPRAEEADLQAIAMVPTAEASGRILLSTTAHGGRFPEQLHKVIRKKGYPQSLQGSLLTKTADLRNRCHLRFACPGPLIVRMLSHLKHFNLYFQEASLELLKKKRVNSHVGHSSKSLKWKLLTQ